MSSPRKKWPQFTTADKKIPLGLWNDLLRTVEGHDASPPPEGYQSREVQAFSPPDSTILRFVELDEAIGPDESSEFRDRTGTVLYWDPSNFTWKRTDPARQITIITDGFEHLVQDQGQRLVVWYHPQAGKFIPVNPSNMRQVKTCKDASGRYPERQECPNVYPTEHITSSYELPEAGTFVVQPTHTTMDSVDRLTPEPPHGGKSEDSVTGYVYNLAGGGDDDSYIPEGTVVPAWFLNGQWWTYWRGLAVCEVSSSESSKSCSSSTQSCSESCRSQVSASTWCSWSCGSASTESSSSEKCTESSTSLSSTSEKCTESSLSCSTISSVSPSSEGCTESSACSSRSSEKCTESSWSTSCTSTTESTPSSLQQQHLTVVTDVCCDNGDLVVVKRKLTLRWHAHAGGYVITEIGDEDDPETCKQGA